MSVQAAINSAIGAVGNTASTTRFIGNIDPSFQREKVMDERKRLDKEQADQKKIHTPDSDVIQTVLDAGNMETYGDFVKQNDLTLKINKIATEHEEKANTIRAKKDNTKQLYDLTGKEEYLNEYKGLLSESTKADRLAQIWSEDAKDIDKRVKAGSRAYYDLLEKYQTHHDIADATEARQRWLEERQADPGFDTYVRGTFDEMKANYLKGGNK